MQKWEYRVEHISFAYDASKVEKSLMELGELGYELVHLIHLNQHNYTCVFKRPKPKDSK